ncbi:MAG: MarR family winged helix-turn-helix transcriptional regulator [Egibacteraceae bacterium]
MEPVDLRFGSTSGRLTAGIAKISLVIRHEAWQRAGDQGLTPTQAQVLGLLASRPPGVRLGAVADELAVTAPTASDAASALQRKGLVQRRPVDGDRRGVALALTPQGRAAAEQAAEWPDLLLDVVRTLSTDEQGTLLRILVKIIRQLQESGRIPVGRMCSGCQFFQPHAYDDARRPHHCAFVDAPFGDPELQLDCADHQPVPADHGIALWERFLTQGGTPCP